jgi:hypothetical protein
MEVYLISLPPLDLKRSSNFKVAGAQHRLLAFHH